MPSGPGSSGARVEVLPRLVGSLVAGMLFFAVTATVIRPGGSGLGGGSGGGGSPPAGAPGPGVLLLVLGVVTLTGIAGYFGFGAAATAQAKRAWERREDDGQGRASLARVLATTTVLRAAMAESFGLFGAVLIMLQGSMIAWAPIGVSVLLLVSLMPAASRLARLEEAATGMRGVAAYTGGRDGRA